MNENTTKRREWVKNAAIIFLVIMLLLTFFSNTIMNYSLPEVVTSYVQAGTITAKVRGTGNVEATDPYNVMVKETRTIASVAVKQGDTVAKDDVLYYLEDKESDELVAAKQELSKLELAYYLQMFDGTTSPEVMNKVQSGNTGSFSSYQAQIADIQSRLQAAEDNLANCTAIVNSLTMSQEINGNNAKITDYSDENAAIVSAKENETNAEKTQISLQEQIERYTTEQTALLARNAELEKIIADGTSYTTTGSTNISTYQTEMETAKTSMETAKSTMETKKTDIYIYIKQLYSTISTKDEAVAEATNKTLLEADKTNAIIDETEYSTRLNKYNNQLAAYNDSLATFNQANNIYVVKKSQYDTASSTLGGYASADEELKANKERLEKIAGKLANKNIEMVTATANVANASNATTLASEALKNAQNNNEMINTQTSTSIANQLVKAKAAQAEAETTYNKVKADFEDIQKNIAAELNLDSQNEMIKMQKEKIAELEAESVGATIVAPVDGTVTSMAYVAGESTKPDEPAAVLQVAGKGYTLSFSVTNEQAKKVQVGDTAELQNAWYYDEDVTAILTAIKPDTTEPGSKKLLVFNVTGSSIQDGQALNLSVGQRSSEYELVVPNSAIREDNNGKFILIVNSKSSPFGNRYIAARVDVEVVASDDNNTAISGALYGYEYVITTSTKPVEAGKQVRLSNQ